MKNPFKDKKIIVLSSNERSRKMLTGIMRVLGFSEIHDEVDANNAFKLHQANQYDVVVGSIEDYSNDIIALCNLIREGEVSQNTHTPVLAVAGSAVIETIPEIKKALITDLLQQPYSLDNISEKLKYILSLDHAKLKNIESTYQDEQKLDSYGQSLLSEEEAESLTEVVLTHYMKHHELIFKKLKIANEATQKCIDEVKKTYDKVKDKDNTNIYQFKDFNAMWEEILNLFVKGGLSENDLFEIEKLIKVIPKDVREHYDDISQQDKSFLALVESLNAMAYEQAKQKVVKFQAQPNPLNGRVASEYEEADPKGCITKSFIYKPKKRVKK